MIIFLRIVCLLFPLIGFLIAIGCWIFKKSELADQMLFFSFIGLFVNLILVLPGVLIIRALLSQ